MGNRQKKRPLRSSGATKKRVRKYQKENLLKAYKTKALLRAQKAHQREEGVKVEETCLEGENEEVKVEVKVLECCEVSWKEEFLGGSEEATASGSPQTGVSSRDDMYRSCQVPVVAGPAEKPRILQKSRRKQLLCPSTYVPVPVEKTPTVTLLTVEPPRAPEKVPEPQYHCLFCYNAVEVDDDKTGPLNSASLEDNFTTMFLLKKMLSVPNDSLSRYLQESPNPGGWIMICKKCAFMVNQAVKIQIEIGTLETRLRKWQEKMVRKIRESWRRTREKEEIKSRDCSEMQVTFETRKFVGGARKRNQTYQVPGENKKPKLEEPRVVKAPPPPPPVNQTTPNSEPREEEIPVPESNEDLENSSKQCLEETDRETCSVTDARSALIDKDEGIALKFGNYNCHVCPMVKMMSVNQLVSHVLFHHKKPLKCSQCNFHYASEADLINRPFSKISGDSHRCTAKDLTSVNYSPKDCLFWECIVCPKRFDTDAERTLHENQRHPKKIREIILDKFNCSTCGHSFRNLGEWRLHRALEHPTVAAMSCYYCDLTFQSKTTDDIDYFDEEELWEHIKKSHRLAHQAIKLPYECSLCGTCFNLLAGPAGLHHHMESVHGVSKMNSFSCPACPVKKLRRERIKDHFNTYHRPGFVRKVHICDLCGFKGYTPVQFKDHQLAKHGLVPEATPVLKCSQEGCSFECVQERKLRRHLMKDHGTERKDKCRVCGKGFLNMSHLKTHEKIHLNANVKPFQCDICGNSFAVKNYLYIHMRLSHQNRPFASTHKKKALRKKTAPASTPNLPESRSTSEPPESPRVRVVLPDNPSIFSTMADCDVTHA